MIRVRPALLAAPKPAPWVRGLFVFSLATFLASVAFAASGCDGGRYRPGLLRPAYTAGDQGPVAGHPGHPGSGGHLGPGGAPGTGGGGGHHQDVPASHWPPPIHVVCAHGAGQCDIDPSTCEPLNTLENCGACGVRCALPGARVSCATGQCLLVGCQRSRGDCDGQAWNGCETRLLESVDHCGHCGVSCRFLPGGASGFCEDGECQITACPPGFSDCDEEPGNGCEQPTNTPAHCGSCDRPCPGPHENATCQWDGQCIVHGCHHGFARCGHECVSLSSSENCGACGVQCPRGTRCQSGVCL